MHMTKMEMVFLMQENSARFSAQNQALKMGALLTFQVQTLLRDLLQSKDLFININQMCLHHSNNQ